MKLYRWKSELLRAHTAGDIIVMAPDVESARKQALEAWDPCTEGSPTQDYYLTVLKQCNADVFEEEYQKRKQLLDKDLAEEPDEITHGVLFISGSE